MAAAFDLQKLNWIRESQIMICKDSLRMVCLGVALVLGLVLPKVVPAPQDDNWAGPLEQLSPVPVTSSPLPRPA